MLCGRVGRGCVERSNWSITGRPDQVDQLALGQPAAHEELQHAELASVQPERPEDSGEPLVGAAMRHL